MNGGQGAGYGEGQPEQLGAKHSLTGSSGLDQKPEALMKMPNGESMRHPYKVPMKYLHLFPICSVTPFTLPFAHR